jgi:broad-specificity NMP kinase
MDTYNYICGEMLEILQQTLINDHIIECRLDTRGYSPEAVDEIICCDHITDVCPGLLERMADACLSIEAFDENDTHRAA